MTAMMHSVFRSDQERVTYKAALADLTARFPGLWRGLKAGVAASETSILGTERMASRLGEQRLLDMYSGITRSNKFEINDFVRGLDTPQRSYMGKMEKAMEVADRAISLPFTALNFVDLATKGMSYTSHIAKRAHMAAHAEGLSGQAYKDFVNEKIKRPP